MDTLTLSDVIAAIRSGARFSEGGVDHRGSESVGGFDSLCCIDGVFHYESEEFHAWGPYRDEERKEHETFETEAALTAFLRSRPSLAKQLIRWLGKPSPG